MADEEKDEDGTEEGEVKAAGKGKKKLVIIIAAVLILVVVGVVVMLSMGGKEDASKKSGEVVRNFKTLELDPFIVNLSEVNNYLKVAIILEYDADLVNQHGKGGGHAGGHSGIAGGSGSGGGGAGGGGPPPPPQVFVDRDPMIKDAIIRVISAKKPQDVLTNEGKELLKDELIEAINEAMGLAEGPIVGVYFKEFILQ